MLGIIAAFKEEVVDYLKLGQFRIEAREGSLRFYRSDRKPHIAIAEGGFGKTRAQEAARQIIERYQPEYIVSAGFAGGVQAGLEPGDLFLCNRLMSVDGPAVFWKPEAAKERFLGDATFISNLDKVTNCTQQVYAICSCLSVPQIVASDSMKNWISTAFSVSIIDMESYWVSEIADSYGIPHMVVRSVLDPFQQLLPTFVASEANEPYGPRWLRAARYALSHPSEMGRLIHLSQQAKVARTSLCQFLAQIDPRRK